MTEKLILIGTHGHYIHALLFDPEKKTLRMGTRFGETSRDPSWLTAHPTLSDVIYANGHVYGKVFALRVTDKEGTLEVMSEAQSGGAGPTHIAVHPQAGIVIAHYKTGNVTTLAISPTGEFLTTMSRGGINSSPTSNFDPLQHFSALPATPDFAFHPRQEAPHAHQVVIHPQSGDVFAPDLGSNVVWRLRWDVTKRELLPVSAGALTGFSPGDGPRHLVFHPDGKYVYTLCELSSDIVIHSLDKPSFPIARHSILPSFDRYPASPRAEQMLASEIVLIPSPSGGEMLLIASNRDSPNPDGDALALFTVSSDNPGQISPAQHQFVFGAGKHLRGVAANKEGKWVCVTSRNPGDVVMYERVGDGSQLREVARTSLGRIMTPVCPLWIE